MTAQTFHAEDILNEAKSKLSQLSLDNSPFQRLEFLIEDIDVFTWLHNQKNIETKIYWSSRHADTEFGGLGIADKATNFVTLTNNVNLSDHNLRYFGGINFNQTQSAWETFEPFAFYLPQFEIIRTPKECRFVINFHNEKTSIDMLLTELQAINFTKETHYRSVPIVLNRTDLPTQEKWETIFETAQDKIKNQSLEKIVLARESIFEFDKAIDPIALLKHLKNITPDCFHFCFQTNKYNGFIGASPERLFYCDDKTLKTEALAGTQKRGITEEDDKQNQADLLDSLKNAREHNYVVSALEDTLKTLCTNFASDPNPQLFKVPEGFHLRTQFTGQLNNNLSVEDIIKTLHPTPAVAGVPTEKAIKTIALLEPFSRGWYAGPVGYVGKNNSEFAVGIRSGLVQEDKLSLFAGAGIVEGSTSQQEWDEIETKITNFIKVFNQ